MRRWIDLLRSYRPVPGEMPRNTDRQSFALGNGPHHVRLFGERRLRPVLAVIDDEAGCSRPTASGPLARGLREARRENVEVSAADTKTELRHFLSEAQTEVVPARHVASQEIRDRLAFAGIGKLRGREHEKGSRRCSRCSHRREHPKERQQK